MFCALSENMEYFRGRINLFIALAPVVKVQNISSGIIRKMKDNATFEQLLVKMN